MRLVCHFRSPLAAVQQRSRWREAGVGGNCAAALHSDAWRETALEEWKAAQRAGASILLWGEPGYPRALCELPDAPLVLYARGDLSLLAAPAVAIVGSRNCTPDGVRLTTRIAADLARAGVCVVSGMALGIDKAAHTAALGEVGRSIGVLGTGINHSYPQANARLFARMAREGLLVSEFSPDEKAQARHFPIRNRLISGLSLGVLVVEAALRSGSLITARLALEQNRSVYAVPGPAAVATSQGCQELVRQGAHPVFNAEDILHDLAPQLAGHLPPTAPQGTAIQDACAKMHKQEGATPHPPPAAPVPVPSPAPSSARLADDMQADISPTGKRLLAAIATPDALAPIHVDALCAATGLPASTVNSTLVELEVFGLVRRWPGGRISLE